MTIAATYKDLKPFDVARVNLLTRGNESLESKNCKQESKLHGAGGNEGWQSRSSGKEGLDAVVDK